ncbi:MAG TPA: helix-turn-helix domain-containing protein [Allocoleopsis sp.]
MLVTDNYRALINQFLPHPIKNDEDFQATQKVIDSLLDKSELTTDEEEYLHLLGTLVYEYEQNLQPIPDIYGVELLKVLMEERGLTETDLIFILGSESTVFDIINQEQKLSLEEIEKLAVYFHISPAAFLPK